MSAKLYRWYNPTTDQDEEVEATSREAACGILYRRGQTVMPDQLEDLGFLHGEGKVFAAPPPGDGFVVISEEGDLLLFAVPVQMARNVRQLPVINSDYLELANSEQAERVASAIERALRGYLILETLVWWRWPSAQDARWLQLPDVLDELKLGSFGD